MDIDFEIVIVAKGFVVIAFENVVVVRSQLQVLLSVVSKCCCQIDKNQDDTVAYSKSCCGDDRVACLYCSLFEELIRRMFCGYINHQALRCCMFNFVCVRCLIRQVGFGSHYTEQEGHWPPAREWPGGVHLEPGDPK